uniref:hypothetical protein n=1 Tax=Agathobacter sp. TaxID=2021311 RepID=UPI004055BB67
MNTKISTDDFITMFLNKEIVVYFKNKKVEDFILKEIYLKHDEEEAGQNTDVTYSYIGVEDSIGFSRKILLANIEAIDFGIKESYYGSHHSKIEIRDIKDFVKKKNVMATSAAFDSLSVFEAEIQTLKQALGESGVSDFLSVDKINRVSLGETDFEYFIKELNLVGDKLNSYTFLIGELILHLEGRYFKDCIQRCMELLQNSQDDDFISKVYFALSFVTNQIRDYDQSFYWLEKYFLKKPSAIEETNFLWWRYLFNTVEFCSYENLGILLKHVHKENRKLSLESLGYVLALNNLAMQAAHVLSYSNNMIQFNWDEIESIYNHLRTDTDNKYHRFLKCVKYISSERKYQAFQSNDNIKGLVFDYVPYRGYGFILGYDMIKYYFHSSEVDSITLKSIRKEICSMQHVAEEELCRVSFSRTVDSKRSYEAYKVV